MHGSVLGADSYTLSWLLDDLVVATSCASVRACRLGVVRRGQMSHNCAFTQSPCGRPSWTLRLIRRRRANRRNYCSSHVICVARRAGAQGPRRRPRGRPPGPWWIASHRGTPSVPSGNPHEGAPSFRNSAVVPLAALAPRRGNAPRRAPSYRFPTVPDGAPPLSVATGAGPGGST